MARELGKNREIINKIGENQNFHIVSLTRSLFSNVLMSKKEESELKNVLTLIKKRLVTS